MYETEVTKKQVLSGCGIVMGIIILFLLFLNVTTIDAGSVGVKTRNGRVDAVLDEGVHFQVPFMDKIVEFDGKTIKNEVDATAASKDLQDVNAKVVMNYKINRQKAGDIYKELGIHYDENVLDPKLHEAIKATTAKYTAEEIITKRGEVKDSIVKELKSKLNENYFILEDINITNIGFSPAFTQAIEQKTIAQQNAIKAQNDLERIKIEGQQAIASAEAQAQAQAKQKETLTPEIIQKMLIEKWNGQLPQYYSGDGNPLNTVITPNK